MYYYYDYCFCYTHQSADLTPGPQPHTTFYIDDNPPAIGILYKNGNKSEPRGDFGIVLESLVEAGANTGYLARVTRAVDGKTK